MDDFYFESNRLVVFIEELYQDGYRTFYLDEIHQYPHWSKDLKIIATGSSALQLDKGTADLSRRTITYPLFDLSFRKYLIYEKGIQIEPFSLDDLLENHGEYVVHINDLADPLIHFEDYLKYGYYPFYKTDRKFYHHKLQQNIHLTLDVDLPMVEALNFSTIKPELCIREMIYCIND